MIFLDKIFTKNNSLFASTHREDGSVCFVADLPLAATQSSERVMYGIERLKNSLHDVFAWDVSLLLALRGNRAESLVELCRASLKNSESKRYEELSDRILAALKSYEVCDIDIKQFPMKDLIVNELLEDFCRERARLSFLLFDEIKQEKDLLDFYKFRFFGIYKRLLEINSQDIHIDTDKLSQYDNPHVSAINKKLKKNNTLRLNFKPVGSKTGRASFGKGSLHVYSLPKDMRSIIKAQDGHRIVQFDYKNFQARIAISLTNDEGFKKKFLSSQDFYSEFGGDREEVKLSFLSWLFSDRYSETFDQQAQPIREHKERLYEQFLETGQIKNVFGRPLFFGENDPKHLIYQNYISSTEADMILELSSIILEKLNKNKEIRLLFPFHDAFVFEIKEDKLNMVDKLEKVISTYYLKMFNTMFPVEIKSGSNFGEMTIFDCRQT
jgi:hypothetical protein